jgi:hypothetical protein
LSTLKNPILIFESIAASEKKTIKRQINKKAILKQIVMKFFTGQENALRIKPYIRKNSGALQNLTAYVGNEFFAGEDLNLTFDVYYELEQYDEFCVYVDNINATYAYDVYVLGLVEYQGGDAL